MFFGLKSAWTNSGRAGPTARRSVPRPAPRSRDGPGRSSGRTGRSGARRRRPYRQAGRSRAPGGRTSRRGSYPSSSRHGAATSGSATRRGVAPSRRRSRPARRSSRTGSSRGRRRAPRGPPPRARSGARHSSAACSVQIRSSRLTQCACVRSRSRACLSTNGGSPSTSTRMTTFETPQPRAWRRPSRSWALAPSRGGNRRPSRG